MRQIFGRADLGSSVGFLLLQRFNVGLAVEYSSRFSLLSEHMAELEVPNADRIACMLILQTTWVFRPYAYGSVHMVYTDTVWLSYCIGFDTTKLKLGQEIEMILYFIF